MCGKCRDWYKSESRDIRFSKRAGATCTHDPNRYRGYNYGQDPHGSNHIGAFHFCNCVDDQPYERAVAQTETFFE